MKEVVFGRMQPLLFCWAHSLLGSQINHIEEVPKITI